MHQIITVSRKVCEKMTNIFSMEGKNVVFTGGCGNLGSVMVKALLEYGASVAVLAEQTDWMKATPLTGILTSWW